MLRSLMDVVTDPNCYDVDRVVAWRDESITFGELNRKAMEYSQILQGALSPWVVVNKSDRVEFVAASLAAWRSNKKVIYIPNLLLSSRQALAEFDPYWMLDDEYIDSDCSADDKGRDFRQADFPSDTVALLFTSGSTGEPTAVAKSFAQFDHELLCLDKISEQELDDCLTVSMVSHLHMYGLMFGVLLPLCRGLPFLTKTVEYWENLLFCAHGMSIILLSSPTHLENIPKGKALAAMDKIKRIYSAGARLEPAVIKQNREYYHGELVEIYGSTEIGALAYKLNGHELWSVLPGMQISQNGDETISARQLLINERVNSAEWHEEWQNMGDLAVIKNSGEFELIGRIDNIVKLAGKRISLLSIERCLDSHRLVKQARALLVGQTEKRIGAVIELNDLGNAMLIDLGRRKVAQSLRECLVDVIEAVAFPRYWRYVDSIPTDAQGKTPRRSLEVYFDKDKPLFPVVMNKSLSDTQCDLVIKIQANLSYFEGHFEGNPILPGVVQLNWARHFSTLYFGTSNRICNMDKIKFMQVIKPNTEVRVRLIWDESRDSINFSYKSKYGSHSSGILSFS